MDRTKEFNLYIWKLCDTQKEPQTRVEALHRAMSVRKHASKYVYGIPPVYKTVHKTLLKSCREDYN